MTARVRRAGMAWTQVGLASFVLLALLAAAAARAQELQIIELRYRLADEIIPIVEPLLEPGGVMNGMDAVLFVRTSPANFEQIRQAVDMLDRKPRQLVITVGQGTVARDTHADVRGSATVGSGDVQVDVNPPPTATPGARDGDSSSVAVRASGAAERAGLHDVGSVRVIEGVETYVAIGQSAPLRTTQLLPGRHGPLVQQTTEYRDVSTGFYATARIVGDEFVLEVSPRQQRVRRATGTDPDIANAGLRSTVRGRLGQWIELGAVHSASSGDTAGLLVWGRRTAASQYSAWVRVDEVP